MIGVIIINNLVKKVAAINDLSGVGRVALTTIIPILSTMGIQVCPFPTDFPGTGDAFTSVLIGELLKGNGLINSIQKVVEFVSLGIKESINYSYPKREGVL